MTTRRTTPDKEHEKKQEQSGTNQQAKLQRTTKHGANQESAH